MGFRAVGTISIILGALVASLAWGHDNPEHADRNLSAPSSLSCPQDHSARPINPAYLRQNYVPPYSPAAVTQAMSAAGLTCGEYSLDSGMRCTGHVAGYPDPVAIFIPGAYRPDQPHDVVMHLHGLGSAPHAGDFEEFLGRWPFARMLGESRRNSIMVVPFSSGGNESTHFAALRGAGFDTLMGRVTDALRAARLQQAGQPDIAVTGHSGAFGPIAGVLRNSSSCHAPSPCFAARIHELHLFEATYAAPQEFVKFADDPNHRLSVSWLAGNRQTEPSARVLREQIMARHGGQLPPNATFTPVRARSSDAHTAIVRQEFASRLGEGTSGIPDLASELSLNE